MLDVAALFASVPPGTRVSAAPPRHVAATRHCHPGYPPHPSRAGSAPEGDLGTGSSHTRPMWEPAGS